VIRDLSREEIDALLREQVVGRVGVHADGLTYVVPVIYAYDGEAVYVLTVEGQKTRMLRESPRACFEVDEYPEPGRWRSAILYGPYEELGGRDAERAIELLRERFAGSGAPRPRTEGRAPVAFRINVDEVTGRASSR
jgi:nitroimidazol reductase NimA-like FMN-containing flavoprotein (pyridoxamine 5'-phosphate oxidase superfamily)